VVGGAATVVLPLTAVNAGSYSIDAAYVDDASTPKFAGSSSLIAGTLVVHQLTPVMSHLTSGAILVHRPSTTLSGSISAGALVPTGAVNITLNSVMMAAPIATDGSFSAVFNTSALPLGTYAISYAYGGDQNFVSANGAGTLKVTYAINVQFANTRAAKSGSTIPVKVSLDDAKGTNVSSAGAVLKAVGIASTTAPNTLLPVQSPANSQPGDLFKYDAVTGTYQFNLKTTGLANGTYVLYFTVTGDPVLHSVTFVIG